MVRGRVVWCYAATLVAAVCACGAVPAPASNASPSAAVERAIDIGKSSARFSIQHIFVTRVTGSVPILAGAVTLAPGTSAPLRVRATLDGSKIDTGDPDQTAAIRGPDYFDTAKFPTWTFASTKILRSSPTAFELDGTLTMHGVAQPERLQVTIGGDALHPVYHATGEIERHAFGMRGARLDPAIGNVANVTLDIVLK